MSTITPLIPKPLVWPKPIDAATAIEAQERTKPLTMTTAPSTGGSTSLSLPVNATRDLAKLVPLPNDPARKATTQSAPSLDVGQGEATPGLGPNAVPEFKADEAAGRQAIEAYRLEARRTAILERMSSVLAGPAEVKSSATSGLARGDSNPLDPFAEIAPQRGVLDQLRVNRTV